MLALELLLVRLFEFSHWHHFAGLSISLALLGLGAAGTCLVLAGDWAMRRIDGLVAVGAGLQSVGTLLVLYLHSLVAVRPLFAAWDGGELSRLLLIDFAAFVPFLGAGIVIGCIFTRWPASSRSIYAANLLGSGVGSLVTSLLLTAMYVEQILALVAMIPAVALTVFALGRRGWRGTPVVGVIVCIAAFLVFLRPPEPLVSDFKALSRVMDLPGVRVLGTQPGLSGKLTVVRSDNLRVAPGLSLEWTEPVPATDAAILSSDRLLPLPGRTATNSSHFSASLVGLPFLLRSSGQVLILGTSTWQSRIAAENREVDWVEPDGRLLELLRERTKRQPAAAVVDGVYRYIATTKQKYSLVAFDATFARGDAATEDYLLTVEGLTAALDRLEPGGVLAVPLALSVPPRHAPRLFAMLYDALKRHGVEQPGRNVAVVRGLQEILFLTSALPFTNQDMQEIRRFSDRWRFDLVWLPDLSEAETNRYHRLYEPVFYLTARALFRDGDYPAAISWFANYSPSSSRPYFWRSLRWDRIPELVRTLGYQRAASYLDWTLLLTAATAIVAALLAMLFILVPLGRLPRSSESRSRTSIIIYFGALGLGYLLLELVFFQRAILFLGEPVMTAALVFAVFLIGSGLGSAGAPRGNGLPEVRLLFGGLVLGLLTGVAVLWALSDAVLGMPRLARMVVIATAIGPLAWALGRPFPWALQQLAGQTRWVPWAWGINGFSSVLAASLATLISVEWGHPSTLAVAIFCYMAAAWVARGWSRQKAFER